MPAIEIIAPDVEAAINQGLAQLRLLRAEVKIEVLEEGARGVLGIGARAAKVRMTPYAEVEAQTRAAAMAALNAPPAIVPPPPPPPPPPSLPVGAPPPPARYAPPARETPARTPGERAERSAPPARPTAERAERPAASVRPSAERPATPRARPPAREDVEVPEGGVDLARDIAEGLVERMGLDAVVEASLSPARASDDEPSVYINIAGADAEALLAHQSEGLNALQMVVQMMWAHQMKSSVRVTVDADGYKASRERKIMSMARRMADRVIETGRPVTLEPMPANERRFVHLALRDDDRVYTESQGEGASRKVVIRLKQG